MRSTKALNETEKTTKIAKIKITEFCKAIRQGRPSAKQQKLRKLQELRK